MKIDVPLRDPFTFSWSLPVLLSIILLLLLLLVDFIVMAKVLPHFEKVRLYLKQSSKKRALSEIELLMNDVNNNQVDNKLAYFRLSKIIRKFIYRSTNINVTSISLKEAKMLKLPQLSELMNEYYRPEFSENDFGHIEESIMHTKEVIEKWK